MNIERKTDASKRTSVDFDWNLIRAFLAVIDKGSLTGAAKLLSSTQPTVGRHIEQLEIQLGKVLFERTGRGLKPTPAALVIAESARLMQSEADDLARAIQRAGNSSRAFVRVAASRQVALQILPMLIEKTQHKAPDIDIGIVASDEISNLLRRDADIAIRNIRPQQASLIAKKVSDTRVQAYASHNYLQRHGAPSTPAELLKHILVGGDRNTEFTQSIEAACKMSGTQPSDVRVAVRSDDYATQFASVKAGLGIGFSLSCLIKRHDDLQTIDFGGTLSNIPFWLAVHREIRTVPAIRTVFDSLSVLLKQELSN